MAHDVNNALAVIMGYAELGLEDAGEHQALRGYLDAILTASRRTADLTRQLLAFARKQVIAPAVLDLNRVVGERADALAATHR